jgi:hypothetical protein
MPEKGLKSQWTVTSQILKKVTEMTVSLIIKIVIRRLQDLYSIYIKNLQWLVILILA